MPPAWPGLHHDRAAQHAEGPHQRLPLGPERAGRLAGLHTARAATSGGMDWRSGERYMEGVLVVIQYTLRNE